METNLVSLIEKSINEENPNNDLILEAILILVLKRMMIYLLINLFQNIIIIHIIKITLNIIIIFFIQLN